jgi:hypothetical protein
MTDTAWHGIFEQIDHHLADDGAVTTVAIVEAISAKLDDAKLAATVAPLLIAQARWHQFKMAEKLANDLKEAFGADSLTNPPIGGNVRQDQKPWERLKISRATWYRLKKPETELDFRARSLKGWRRGQEQRARHCSVRTVQRRDFVWRYGIDALHILGELKLLPPALLEDVARLEHEEQQQFVARLIELAPSLPLEKGFQEQDRNCFVERHGTEGALFSLDKKALKKAARYVYDMVIIPRLLAEAKRERACAKERRERRAAVR